jgi:hypothetical protein
LICSGGTYRNPATMTDDDLLAMRPGQSRHHEILRQLRRAAS